MRICLIALIGLPAAGKTSFSIWLLEQQQQQQNEINLNIIHMCYDKLLNVKSYSSDYKQQRSIIIKLLNNIIVAYKATKELPVELLQHHQIAYTQKEDNNDLLIICDDNHYYRSMRYKLYQICREQQISYAQIYFKCNLQDALKRNATRHLDAAIDAVPEDVIHNMCERLEPPPNAAVAGNSWESNTFIIDCRLEDICLKEIMSFFGKSCELTPPVTTPQIPVEKPKQPSSDVHNLDILLRKRIKELLTIDKVETKELKSIRVLNLNTKRKEILAKFKASTENTESDLNSYVELLK